ncbi:MAG: hypothetical protein QOF76_5250 [Solirubrobacteraceae bacterium]|nr:hypothetical protein [Solirubrobacteraceae bacterium]
MGDSRRLRRGALAAVGALCMLPCASSAQTNSPQCVPRTDPPGVGLTLVKTETPDDRTSLFSFRSTAIGDAWTPDGLMQARVIVPQQYLTHPRRRFPVVYHLHGTGNTATTWDLGDVEKFVLGTTPVILVLPDGGKTSGYTDWVGTPVSSGSQAAPPAWDTWQNRELVPWVDAHFRTNGHRAIAGSSMGGFGSIAYTERHPELYDAAASLSGAVDIEQPSGKVVAPLIWSPCAFGDPVLDADNWHANNPTAQVEKLRGKSLYVQVGNGLPGEYDTPATAGAGALEVLIRQMTLSFIDALNVANIPVTVRLYGNGTHPDGVGPTRFYDFDGMRLFLKQAMPVITTTRCRMTYRLPRRARRVRLTVDGERHTFRRHGRRIRFTIRSTANAAHRIHITARRYSRTARVTGCPMR